MSKAQNDQDFHRHCIMRVLESMGQNFKRYEDIPGDVLEYFERLEFQELVAPLIRREHRAHGVSIRMLAIRYRLSVWQVYCIATGFNRKKK